MQVFRGSYQLKGVIGFRNSRENPGGYGKWIFAGDQESVCLYRSPKYKVATSQKAQRNAS